MKKILCFGDSNTYGFNPENGTRFEKNCRWSGILEELAKEKFEIIEAGCNNRTCFSNNSLSNELTGIKFLPEVLNDSYYGIILALGINDLQKIYNPTLKDFKQGLNKTIKKIKELNHSIKIVLMCPCEIQENILKSYFSNLFDKSSIEKSKKLNEIYQEVAKENNCFLFNLNDFTKSCELDGLHFSIEAHKIIAIKMHYFLNKNL